VTWPWSWSRLAETTSLLSTAARLITHEGDSRRTPSRGAKKTTGYSADYSATCCLTKVTRLALPTATVTELGIFTIRHSTFQFRELSFAI
jgi:hypothetical protein